MKTKKIIGILLLLGLVVPCLVYSSPIAGFELDGGYQVLFNRTHIYGCHAGSCYAILSDGTGSGGGSNFTLDMTKIQNYSTANCPNGYALQGKLQNGTLNCTTLAGGGDVTAVYTSGAAMYGGSDTGDIYIYVNMSYLNATMDARDSVGSGSNNCSNDNSCDNITYDVELAYINNCSVDSSCSNIFYNSESTIAYYQSLGLWSFNNFTATNISRWDEAYDWGDHSLEGYITSYVDTKWSVSVRDFKNNSGTLELNWTLINLTIDARENDTIINNCSVDGSCQSIIYDSDIASYPTKTNLADNLSNYPTKTNMDNNLSAQDACDEITGCQSNAYNNPANITANQNYNTSAQIRAVINISGTFYDISIPCSLIKDDAGGGDANFCADAVGGGGGSGIWYVSGAWAIINTSATGGVDDIRVGKGNFTDVLRIYSTICSATKCYTLEQLNNTGSSSPTYDLNLTGTLGTAQVITDNEILNISGNGSANCRTHLETNKLIIECDDTDTDTTIQNCSGRNCDIGCGNITGTTSNLCTIEDTDTFNTTSDILAVVNPKMLAINNTRDDNDSSLSQKIISVRDSISPNITAYNVSLYVDLGNAYYKKSDIDTKDAAQNGSMLKNGSSARFANLNVTQCFSLNGSVICDFYAINKTGSTLTQEQVEDMVGGMLDGTETHITVDYDDDNGNIDFVVSDDWWDECADAYACGWWDEGADVPANEISESSIDFDTACAAGNHLYVNGDNLACEPDATGSFTNGTAINVSKLILHGLYNCDTLNTTADGTVVCATDANTGVGGNGTGFWYVNGTSLRINQTLSSGVDDINVTNGYATGDFCDGGGCIPATAVQWKTSDWSGIEPYTASSDVTLDGTLYTDDIEPVLGRTANVGQSEQYYDTGYFNKIISTEYWEFLVGTIPLYFDMRNSNLTVVDTDGNHPLTFQFNLTVKFQNGSDVCLNDSCIDDWSDINLTGSTDVSSFLENNTEANFTKVYISGLSNCDTVNVTPWGELVCGTDADTHNTTAEIRKAINQSNIIINCDYINFSGTLGSAGICDGTDATGGGGTGYLMINGTDLMVNLTATSGYDDLNLSGDLTVYGTIGNITHRYSWADLNYTIQDTDTTIQNCSGRNCDIGCGNITGATSDLCDLTDSHNSSADILNVVNPLLFDINASVNESAAYYDINVNSSEYWDGLDSPSDINAGDITDDGTYATIADVSALDAEINGTISSVNTTANIAALINNTALGFNFHVWYTNLIGLPSTVNTTTQFSGDVTGTYNAIVVVDTAGLSGENITSGTIAEARIHSDIARDTELIQNCSGRDCDIGWGNLTGVPAGLDDGDDDTQLTENEVEAYIFDDDNTDNFNMSVYNISMRTCTIYTNTTPCIIQQCGSTQLIICP